MKRGGKSWLTTLGCLAAGALVCAPAEAGTPEPPEDLGSAKGLDYIRVKHKDVVSQTGGPATCDDGDFATGGGGATNGAPQDAALNATAPTSSGGDGWQAEGRTLSAAAKRVTTYAICGAGEVAWDQNTTTLTAGTGFGFGNECPGSDVATGGGITSSGGDARIVRLRPETFVFDWVARVQNVGTQSAAVSHRMGCSDAYEVATHRDSTRVPAGESAKAIARCAAGEAVTGGGLEVTKDGSPQIESWATSTRPWDSQDRRRTPDDGWLAQAQNGSDAGAKLRAFAVCKG